MDNNYDQRPDSGASQQYDPYGNNPYASAYNYGNPEIQKAPNIFQQFVISFLPPQYDRLAKVKTGSMIGFVTLLVLVATVISFVILAIGFLPGISGDGSSWVDELPDFELSDGRLRIDEPFLYAGGASYIYMTEEVNGFSLEDARAIADGGYRNILLLGRDRISVWQNGEYQQANYDHLGSNLEINREWIADTLMPIFMAVLAVVYIIFFVGRVFWYFLCAAVYLLFGMLIAGSMHKRLSAGTLYRAAVYSKVLMFVVTTFLSEVPFVNFSIPFSLRIVVTLSFMGVAISKLSDGAR